MQKVMNHEYCGLGWKQTVQRPWGRTQLGSLEEQRGGLGGWSRTSVGDREEERAGRGRGSSCRAAWASGRWGPGGLWAEGVTTHSFIPLFPSRHIQRTPTLCLGWGAECLAPQKSRPRALPLRLRTQTLPAQWGQGCSRRDPMLGRASR